MTDGLIPYEEYKNSGIAWLGEVPAHWDTVLNQRIFRETTRNYSGSNEIQLSLSQKDGLIPTTDLKEKTLHTASFDNFKIVEPSDLVLNRFKAHLGVFFASTLRGIVTFHYGVFQPRVEMETRYFELLFHTEPYKTIYAGASNGMTIGLQNLSNQNFYNVRAIVPPTAEQKTILAYLDYADRRIHRYVKAKQKLIELLNEHKQIIIQQVITQGLDPTVPMKDSGIKWLGEIPAHWETRRLKYLAQFNPSRANSKYNIDSNEHIVFLPMVNISDKGEIDNTEKRRVSESSSGYTYFERGDVVIAKITPCFENGKGAWLHELESDIGFGTTELIVLRPNTKILPQFLYYLTHSNEFRKIGEGFMIGSAGQKRIPTSFVQNYIVAYPPKSEQAAIIQYIEAANKQFDKTIQSTKSNIHYIQEFYTRLIDDVVTGKLDVREAAHRLPEDIEDLINEQESTTYNED